LYYLGRDKAEALYSKEKIRSNRWVARIVGAEFISAYVGYGNFPASDGVLKLFLKQQKAL
jgi:hypothetical protein